jgi:hypothetical protein
MPGKLLFVAAMLGWNLSICQGILHAEMLGRPTDKGISVKTIFDAPVEARISYGILSGHLPDHTNWQAANPDTTGEAVSVIELKGLLPSTQYYYALEYRAPGNTAVISGQEHRFHTARGPGEAFTFTIQADPHLDASSDTALYRRCLRNQLEDQPDFMIDLGDFLMTDKLKNSGNFVPEDTIPYRCKLLRSFYESINHSAPLFIALGNHEGEAGWYNNGTPANIAVWDTKYRKKYFLNPLPDYFYSGDTTHYKEVGQREAYYSWQWGDALFIVLDPYWFTKPKPDSLTGWRWTLGRQQYDWLKATLEKSDSKYKFVICHQLVGGDKDGRGGTEKANYYEWGGSNLDGSNGWTVNRPGWYKPIKDLLKEHQVTIFFHGHDHLYDKQEMDCLVYQEVPQPSLPNFMGVPQAMDYGYLNGTIIPNSGHLRVSVAPSGIKVEYVRAYLPSQENISRHNKDVSDSYEIINCYASSNNEYSPNGTENLDITAFPNPFSNSVTISIGTVIKDEQPLVFIYDIRGNLVTKLNTEETAGNGTCLIHWDGNDSKGCRVTDGIYFCRCISGNSCSNSKLILTR